MDADKEPVWIFGYGSLLWKTNFPFIESQVGHVRGYMRRFWQGSTDHRGVPEAPGRVVTLIENDKELTWGIAYQTRPEDVPEVMAYLDKRESGGYTTKNLTFHPKGKHNGPLSVLAYIATESNPNYLGPSPVEEMAKQITSSTGKSGPNSEYVLELARCMRIIAPSVDDQHLFELEEAVLRIINKSQK